MLWTNYDEVPSPCARASVRARVRARDAGAGAGVRGPYLRPNRHNWSQAHKVRACVRACVRTCVCVCTLCFFFYFCM